MTRRLRSFAIAAAIASATAAVAGNSALSGGAEPARTPPRVEVEAVEIDVGEVVRGQRAEAEFVLRNSGGEVLRILSAKPG